MLGSVQEYVIMPDYDYFGVPASTQECIVCRTMIIIKKKEDHSHGEVDKRLLFYNCGADYKREKR